MRPGVRSDLNKEVVGGMFVVPYFRKDRSRDLSSIVLASRTIPSPSVSGGFVSFFKESELVGSAVEFCCTPNQTVLEVGMVGVSLVDRIRGTDRYPCTEHGLSFTITQLERYQLKSQGVWSLQVLAHLASGEMESHLIFVVDEFTVQFGVPSKPVA